MKSFGNGGDNDGLARTRDSIIFILWSARNLRPRKMYTLTLPSASEYNGNAHLLMGARLADSNITILLCVLNTSIQHRCNSEALTTQWTPSTIVLFLPTASVWFFIIFAACVLFFSFFFFFSSCIMDINGSLWYHIVWCAAKFIL